MMKSGINITQALKILGLESGATKKQIKKAYRRKAVQCHPDKGGNKEKFMLVKQAHDYLNEFGTTGRHLVDNSYSIAGFGIDMCGISIRTTYVRTG